VVVVAVAAGLAVEAAVGGLARRRSRGRRYRQGS